MSTSYFRIKAAAERVRDGFITKEHTSHRVTQPVWKHILLFSKEKVIIDATVRTLQAKSLGCGVYEITSKD